MRSQFRQLPRQQQQLCGQPSLSVSHQGAKWERRHRCSSQRPRPGRLLPPPPYTWLSLQLLLVAVAEPTKHPWGAAQEATTLAQHLVQLLKLAHPGSNPSLHPPAAPSRPGIGQGDAQGKFFNLSEPQFPFL